MADGDFDTLDELDAASAADSQGSSDFTPGTQPAAISFVTDLVQPASQPGVYVNVDDTIELLVTNSSSVVTSLTAQVRILLPDGTVQYSQLTISGIPATYVPQSATLTQVEGFILSVVAGPVGSGVERGECFVQVNVVRGADPTQLTTVALVADYVTSGFLPSWPFGQLRSAIDGRGTLKLPQVGGGAGQHILMVTSVAVQRWRLIGIYASLHTDATAGQRPVRMEITSPGGGTFTVSAPFTQAPNVTQEYVWGAAMAYSPSAMAVLSAPLPQDLVLPGGTSVQVAASNAGGTDGWTFLVLTVEEWIDV